LDNLLEIRKGSLIFVAVDSWCWKHDPNDYFSVKPAYLVLRQSTADEVFFSEDETRLRPQGCRLFIISGSRVSLQMMVLLCVSYVV
jgi:hypothetical protein